ncbi:MIP/aquaporin family protein [Jiangella alba]|uniref:Aquaporin rerated protein n=1 Tax=Jiangella alba TaxID=561176 RepID=A0A1H5H8C4_9ACTN|nr:aquaporin [Jiangella alba]SEE23518.1 aquaporin rerated protein [Jiangella alba]
MDNLSRNVIAEAFGAFLLIALTVVVVTIGPGLIPAALTYGFATAALVAALGHVSGGHFNPAITLAYLLSKQIDFLAAVAYWIAQFLGAAAGALTVRLITDSEVVTAGTPVIADDVSVGGAILAEAVATMILVLVIFGTVVDRRAAPSVYPMAIGITVTAGFFAIAPLTGGALNPARGFGPAVISGEWGGAAAWLAGPILGAVLAWALYRFAISGGDENPVRGRGTDAHALPPPPGSSLLP